MGIMKNSLKLGVAFALAFTLTSCQPSSTEPQAAEKPLSYYQDKLAETLADPKARLNLIAKVLGTTEDGERHAYLKFHIYGFAGDGNVEPLFSMNNYVIQDWKTEDGTEYEVSHREVAYYSKFDSTEPISEFENPFTGETIELPPFVLGPVPRFYSIDPAEERISFDSDPLNITMIGDRVYVPTLTIIKFPNQMTPEEWGAYSNGDSTFWDSMVVYSAEAADVFDPDKTHVDAEIHMQNLVSWSPYFKMGQNPGRTMARAYGQHINGFEDLPTDIRENLKKYTPEIFDENWTEMRIDSVELVQDLQAKRQAGTLDIDQEGYVPFEIKIPSID